ncbi:MAG: hypothetical protein R2909_14860 [Gemmatimonadales bacterium]
MATLALLATGVIATALVPGWVGLAFGVAVLVWLALWLVAPRRSLERCMDAGVVPACRPSRLAGVTVLWSAGLALALVLAAPFTFAAAAHAAADVFAPLGAVPDRSAVAGFVAANLLRLQLFLSAPDIFGIAVPTLEHQPMLGSALTLLFRSALNLGFVSIVLTALSVSYTRVVSGSQLVANAELTLRIEALRGGRFGPALARHHAELVQEELWSLLVEADDPDTRRALAAIPVYDCRIHAPAPAALGERLALASAALGLARRGWRESALGLLTAGDGDGRPDHPFPATQVAVEIERGLGLRQLGRPDDAARAFARAETHLTRGAEAMSPSEREMLRAELERESAGGDGVEQSLQLESGLADGGPSGAPEHRAPSDPADQRARQDERQ